MNDPNGPVHWHGRYHLFFQYNPHGPVHDRICWGHASSADLASWVDEPIALTPGPGGPDAAGCWSGCVVIEDDVAIAVYTGGADGPDTTSICLATSRDERLTTWSKRADAVAHAPPHLGLTGFRDPFVFSHRGRRYALVGAGRGTGGQALLLLFACDDLTSWAYLGVLLDTSDPVAGARATADVWECPQLLELDHRWVLILSLVVGELDRVAYLVGDLVEAEVEVEVGGVAAAAAGLRFVPETGGLVDHGHDFYAPAVLATRERTLMWAWTWEDRPDSVGPDSWAGALTLTRQLALSEDARLLSRPVAEIDLLHGDRTELSLRGPRHQVALPDGAVDVVADLVTGVTPDRPQVVVLELVAALRLRLELDLHRGTAELHRDVCDERRRTWLTRGAFPAGATACRVRIILDGSVAEIYVENGPTFTERVYDVGPRTLEVRSDPAASCRVTVARLT